MRVPLLMELTTRSRFELDFICCRMALLAKNFFKGTKVGFKDESKVKVSAVADRVHLSLSVGVKS